MVSHLATLILAVGIFVPDSAPPQPTPAIRTIAVPGLHDIALASIDRDGPVIYIEPSHMSKAGAAARFFMAHEFAHHDLGHVLAQAMGDPRTHSKWLRRSMELAADCAAASTLTFQGDTQALEAAFDFFEAQGSQAADSAHPPGHKRAEMIRRCAH